MHKLMVLYPEPADRAAFIDYYTSTHLPKVAKLPGLQSWSYALDVAGGPEGSAPYFAVFEAEFADAQSFTAAMASPEGQEVAQDVPNYASGGAITLDFSPTGSSAS
ncbi:EthD family reductase [Glutamicibacter sp. X7]